MWWILSGSLAIALAAAILIARQKGADRRRMATWEDLSQRKQLIASQLAFFRDRAAKKPGA